MEKSVLIGNTYAAPVPVVMVPPVEAYPPGEFVKTPQAPFVRSPYNYDTNRASDESGIKCVDPSLAVQDERDEVDINTIVRRFGLTGKLPDDVRVPQYGDFSDIDDYHSAMNAVIAADEEFMRLPAELRSKFDNDPGKFVDFCMKEENREELGKLGLLRDGVSTTPAGTQAVSVEPGSKKE